jgi:hypothetical protein
MVIYPQEAFFQSDTCEWLRRIEEENCADHEIPLTVVGSQLFLGHARV